MFIPFHDDNPTRRFPFVTITLIVMNVLVLAYMHRLERTQGTRALRIFVHQYGFIPLRAQQFVKHQPMRVDLFPEVHPQDPRLGALRFADLPANRTAIVASLFTAMFLHANFVHLLGNMWFLWLFGNNVEDRLGHLPFLVFYLLGGVIATATHWAMSPLVALSQPVIGASGAVAVTLGAYAVTYPFAKIRTLVFVIIFFTVVELPALVVLGFWFLLQVFNGLSVAPGGMGHPVAWWAHIGGFVVGAIIMPLLTGPNQEPFDYKSSFPPPFDPT